MCCAVLCCAVLCCGCAVLRMVLGGVFDRFPKLQVVIGHMGEGLPFFIRRVDVMPGE
jgi:uncharacterized protein